jgi:hypothetical protein
MMSRLSPFMPTFARALAALALASGLGCIKGEAIPGDQAGSNNVSPGPFGPGTPGGSTPGGGTPGGGTPGGGTPGGGTPGGGTPVVPGANPGANCNAIPLPVAGAVRLSPRQFSNSVAGLFPFPITLGDKYPPLARGDLYTTEPAAGEVLFAGAESLVELAESVGLEASRRVTELVPCSPTAVDVNCVRTFITNFATRAYRRPLQNEERDGLHRLFDTVRAAPDPLPFDLAIGAVVAAVLQSPQFLYRVEIGEPAAGGVRRLTAWEMASRLSYLFWDDAPDPMLLERARTGALVDPATIEAEAARLLNDPRAAGAVWRFFSEWLSFGDEVYGGRVDAALAQDFIEESRRFVAAAALGASAGPAARLFDSDRSFVNRRLATHYGLPNAASFGDDWREVTLPPAFKAGLLAKAQIATAFSAPGETSVTLRGHFVTGRLLCNELGAAPPGAQSMNPVLPAGSTIRQRIDARIAMAGCGSCHRILDNAGIGLEDLDHQGRPRAMYGTGQPVVADGRLVNLPGEPTFTGTAGLGQLLAGRAEPTACLVQHWYEYATGHHATPEEQQCQVGRLLEQLNQSGGNLRQMLIGIVRSPAFAQRRAP